MIDSSRSTSLPLQLLQGSRRLETASQTELCSRVRGSEGTGPEHPLLPARHPSGSQLDRGFYCPGCAFDGLDSLLGAPRFQPGPSPLGSKPGSLLSTTLSNSNPSSRIANSIR